jgi:hypothetical protein
MKINLVVFFTAIALFLVAFVSVDIVAGVDTLTPLEGRQELKEMNPDLNAFIHYLIATATGLAAVFLRKLIKRWFPDFEETPRNFRR